MKSQNFQQPLSAARTYTLGELLEAFFKYNKIDAKDESGMKKTFELFAEMFTEKNQPIPVIPTTFKVGYLVWFQHFLAEMDYAKSEVKRKFGFFKRVLNWAGKAHYDQATWDSVPAIIPATFIAEMNALKPINLDHCRENERRLDAPVEHVELLLIYLPPVIADMLHIQLLTGMRPGEVCKMTVGDLKRTKEDFAEYHRLHDGQNWLYIRKDHKTRKHIGKKVVPICLEAQDILTPYLAGKPDEAPVFAKTSKRGFGKPFTSEEYYRHIQRRIAKHNLPKVVPYQIRHTNLSQVSNDFGRDTARAVADHTTEEMTAVYDHSDLKKALKVANERNRRYAGKTTDAKTSRFAALFQSFPGCLDN